MNILQMQSMDFGISIPPTAVRSTTSEVNASAPPAEMPDAPEYNEPQFDTRREGGLETANLASHVVPSQPSAANIGNSNHQYNAAVNAQISSSGLAAQKVAAGEWGSGSLKITEGIEPTIVDGQQLRGVYFLADPVEMEAPAYGIGPADMPDGVANAMTQATGEQASKQAIRDSLYAAWLGG